LEHALRLNLDAWSRLICPQRASFVFETPLHTLAISPDGKFVALGQQHALEVWETSHWASTGKSLSVNYAAAPVFSPDGKTLAFVEKRETIQLWDWTGAANSVRKATFPGTALTLAWSPDGATIAVGGTASKSESQVLLLSVAHLTVQEFLPHPKTVKSLSWAPDGKSLWTACRDGLGRCWDFSGKPRTRPARTLGHQEGLSFLTLSADGRTIATGSTDKIIRLWNADSGTLVRQFIDPAEINQIALSRDGTFLAAGSADKSVRIWSVESGTVFAAPYWHYQSVAGVAWCSDGRTLLSCGDRYLQIRSLCIGPSIRAVLPHTEDVSTVAYSADGQLLLTTTKSRDVNAGNARFWSPLGTALGPFIPHQGLVLRARFAHGKSEAATASKDDHVRFLDAPGSVSRVLEHPNHIWDLAWSPDDRTLLTGCYDGASRIWDCATGRLIKRFDFERPVMCVAWHPDGIRFVTGHDDGSVVLWQSTSLQPLQRHEHAGLVKAVAFTPDGRIFLSASFDGTAQAWDVASARRLFDPFVHQDQIRALALSSDGRFALTGSADNTARVWNLTNGKASNPWHHKRAVNAVAWSRDNSLAATGGEDHAIRLWDVATSRAIGPPLEHGDAVLDLAFDPAGTVLASGGRDETARLWWLPKEMSGDPEHLTQWARQLTGLELDDSDVIRKVERGQVK
jgi:WD40 repeat protein